VLLLSFFFLSNLVVKKKKKKETNQVSRFTLATSPAVSEPGRRKRGFLPSAKVAASMLIEVDPTIYS